MSEKAIIGFFYVFMVGLMLGNSSCRNPAKKASVSASEEIEMARDSSAITQFFIKSKSNKDAAGMYKKQAEELARKSNNVHTQSVYLALLAKDLLYAGQLKVADSIADKGLELAGNGDTLQKGKFYNIKGNIAGLKKNIHQSIEYYLLAEKIFTPAGDSAALAGIYSNIANAYFSLKDYPSANQYATKAYHLLPSVKDPNIAANINITFALSLNKVGRNNEALPIVKKADSMADATQNKMAKLASTIGLAEVYKANYQFDSAANYYQQCIALSKAVGVKHFELMSMMGLLAMSEEQKRYDEVLRLATPTIELARQLQNSDVLHTAKRIAGKAYGHQGQYQRGFELLSASYTLYDSVAGEANQKNINELLVKYDTEKKEREILNQNLLLARQKIELRNRQGIIFSLATGLAILLLVIFYVRRLNKERLIRHEAEQQKKVGDAYIYGEQKERTRLAYEIHDGIASMLTGISYKLRADDAQKEEILELLTTLHEDTRRISHSLMPVDFERKNLTAAVENLCEKMSTDEIEILFAANAPVINLDIPKNLLLYRVIQELINNALKYARCKSIFVRINSNPNLLEITVEDDGIGIAENIIDSGFKSIRQRMEPLHGVMTINTIISEGTTIKITCTNE